MKSVGVVNFPKIWVKIEAKISKKKFLSLHLKAVWGFYSHKKTWPTFRCKLPKLFYYFFSFNFLLFLHFFSFIAQKSLKRRFWPVFGEPAPKCCSKYTTRGVPAWSVKKREGSCLNIFKSTKIKGVPSGTELISNFGLSSVILSCTVSYKSFAHAWAVILMEGDLSVGLEKLAKWSESIIFKLSSNV